MSNKTDKNEYKFNSIGEAIEDIRQGKMVILCDDEDRENEGDLTMAAEKVTPEAINFMAKLGRGLICLPLTSERCEELQLHPMVSENTSAFNTAFTVSIESKKNVTTGISASDRAITILTAIDPNTKPADLAKPGHIFPLKSAKGGVLVRSGQTEGAVDLARLAGLYSAGVICEIMNDDGTMSRVPELMEFAKKHNLKIITIKDLIQYRLRNESFIKKEAQTILPTDFGNFTAIAYRSIIDNHTHIALVKGKIDEESEILVRVHSMCLTGDVFGSRRCDCGEQLRHAMAMIEKEGKGVILYLYQEGRGIGLLNKIKAYELQDQGMDTVEANEHLGFKPDLREYGIGAQILVDLGLKKIRIITNNPRKIIGIHGYGLEVVERVPTEVAPRESNLKYLKTKQKKLGHVFDKI
ncbi:MAG: bifunctional 3,4-dihydroxy-2-butanone 4-phosphate synthase/GTP cyclohydrolase II [Candidatus Schekmanbacteria bacterium RIFCSPHIGHO2_02_FULL_38_11]|uniref:Riboflavin biosynthesis protein RibBA n=1 Tax=Candidatus Schekmanbacteria bacterium RIFCSPLOWO2_12_FULL_38_15 TaxID=1817883 RepID=A0A1F7SEF9_9BACT|nr:MAG: bifunctional 3,4-dihydroxy-2-butanone 4-phosphate synthase/GTP cyclohydrolase II [Candidatus Schekmanbacteria bacterium GWA2_38_9]OGL49469.1 MAG: bifunctional 3,4-dihydroxy-2-butanone 4-phosphate synthase/GTP cyclohydrolase II [Candidatus Schekmanbacteria bacterium RIFCSPLOWO2_02_FULL_38_14]OGL52166.1 MAG: bifunctional 3,4-dihydroxy-2-butanone 4-phosphate synthase/GTP cyclohydrolase II [Candidatus Schekmanbacteria bacterium RIFCSPLOWO2_12_FULL_38_15]OGL53579.1 MAG: bifunctional 3,4-dihyd